MNNENTLQAMRDRQLSDYLDESSQLSEMAFDLFTQQESIKSLKKALTKIKSHNGCIAVIRRIAEDALKEAEG